MTIITAAVIIIIIINAVIIWIGLLGGVIPHRVGFNTRRRLRNMPTATIASITIASINIITIMTATTALRRLIVVRYVLLMRQ
jgi:hypothetical protein